MIVLFFLRTIVNYNSLW